MGLMLNWMPGVTHVPRGGGSPIPGPNNVIVLHTTETDRPASYNGTEPHFEVYGGEEVSDAQAIRQFIPLDSSAKALYNAAGGVETNRRAGHIVQIEIVWRAANARNMTDTLLRRVALVSAFIRSQMDVPLQAPPQPWWQPGTIATEDGPLRFSWSTWNVYAGFCAHVHVPENDHWDAGDFPWSRFLTFLAPEGDLNVEQILAALDALNDKIDLAIALGTHNKTVMDEWKREMGDWVKDSNWHNLGEALAAKDAAAARRLEEWGLYLRGLIEGLPAATGGPAVIRDGETVKITRA